MIDTSPMYGRAEDVVGDLVEMLRVRDRVFLATKVWTSGLEKGISQMRESLRLLRVRQIDLMQVHNLVDVDVHLRTLRRWKDEGLARYIGITHYTASSHREVVRMLERAPVDFVQINYSVAEREAEKTVLRVAADRGVAVIVNRPFGGGSALGSLARMPLPSWASDIDCTSWSQVLLKFVLSHPAVTCAIPATSKPDHLRDNLAAGGGRMPDEKMREEIATTARRGTRN
jgi:diketogulonate reductase-like aldo/keto reductase